MMKKNQPSHSYDVRIEEAAPKLEATKSGTRVLCPFCAIPHPIAPGEEANCGTQLKVTAVRAVLPGKRAKKDKVRCLKCHKTEGGDMARYMNGWVHTTDCLPGTRFLAHAPAFSKWAGAVGRLGRGNPARKFVEAFTGPAQEVREIDPEGKETGKVLGHFFLKPQKKA